MFRFSHVRIFGGGGLGFARFVHLRKSPFHDFIARVLRVRKSVRRCGEKAEEVPSAFYTHILHVLRHRVLEQSAEQFRIAEVRADREHDEQDINGKGLHMREAVCQVCGQRTAHVADHQHKADRGGAGIKNNAIITNSMTPSTCCIWTVMPSLCIMTSAGESGTTGTYFMTAAKMLDAATIEKSDNIVESR